MLEIEKVDGKNFNYSTERNELINITNNKFTMMILTGGKQYGIFDLQLLPFYSREFERPCLYRAY